jgi:pilus assembly protein CpaC
MKIAIWTALLMLVPTCVLGEEGALPAEMMLAQGDSRVLNVDIRRAALGNGHVVSISTPERGQLLLFGEAPGTTTARLWLRNGTQHLLRIVVTEQDLQARLDQVNRLLSGMPSVTARVAADRILLEGSRATAADRQRAASVAALFPGQVLDFVGKVGWESMVQMDVRIIEVRRDQMKQLGLQWDSQIAGPTANLRLGSGKYSPVLTASLLSTVTSRIDLLKQRGMAQVIAEPTLSCRSGGVARFVSGGEVPIPVTDGLGGTSVQYKEYGVIVEIRPRAEPTGFIYADIQIELSQIDSSVRIRDFPGFIKRQSSTAINAQAGETIAIAGLMGRERSRDRQGIPGLGSLPVAGALFSGTRAQERQTELVVLVTPRVFEAGMPGTPDAGQLQKDLVEKSRSLSAGKVDQP